MRERVALAGGTLTVDTGEHGTVVEGLPADAARRPGAGLKPPSRPRRSA